MKQEAVFLKESSGPCEIHDWPTAGLARRLFEGMRERHGKGGLNVCRDCIARASEDAKRLRELLNSARVVR